MALDTRLRATTFTSKLGARTLVATDEKGSGLSQPSDWDLRAKKHPAKHFAKEAETRNESNSIDADYDWPGKRFRISARGPLAMAVLAIAAVAFLYFVLHAKG